MTGIQVERGPVGELRRVAEDEVLFPETMSEDRAASGLVEV